MIMPALVAWTWFLIAQAVPVAPAQPASLKNFEGTWVIDKPRDHRNPLPAIG